MNYLSTRRFSFNDFLSIVVIAFAWQVSLAQGDLQEFLKDSPKIEGRVNYLDSPFVTAGDRVYMVGNQDGSFPELGWHVKGEMGGIWDHPIKLMDGFDAELVFDNHILELKGSKSFVNYPMANLHRYDLDSVQLKAERIQFVPDGLEGIVVEYSLHNTGGKTKEFIFRFTGHADLRPTWLGEKTGMIDGKDQSVYLEGRGSWMVKDSLNSWYVVYGEKGLPVMHKVAENTYRGSGATNVLEYEINLKPGESQNLLFTIAGSYRSEEEALSSFDRIADQYISLFKEKRDRYNGLKERSKLTIPDKEMQQAFEWLKYNCDWLIRTVPEIGTGMMAGIPDYPWWFGVDSEYALKGYMAVGQHEVAYKTIRLLDSISNAVNGNGRIVHEVSTNGFVFNRGNINETPQFASLIWEVYRWNGREEFLEKYFPTIEKGLDWLLKEKDADGNLFPEGFGMMEIHGLDSEMIDVASYTQRAFHDAASIARELEKDGLALEYEELAEKMKQKINKEFWSDEFGSYADFIGTDQQALHLIEDAIVRADTLNKPWAVEELKETKKKILQNPSQVSKPFVLHHNWVVNTPMEMEIADHDKALVALKTAERFVNPFGIFVTGIDRDASAGSDEGSFEGSKIFSYTGAVMTLPTGVQTVAENNYGRGDKALNYLERMTRTFSYALPGSMYEVSPDYGMISQAWNIYGFAVPIVQQFFGVQPHASEKRILVRPRMPKKWEQASLEHVTIGENVISVHYKRSNSELYLRVEQSRPEWTLTLCPPASEQGQIQVIQGELHSDSAGPMVLSNGSVAELRVMLQADSERK